MTSNNKIIKNLVAIDLKKEFKSYDWIFIIIMFFVLNLVSKFEVYNISLSFGNNFNWWDVLYNIIQNQYFVLSLFIPLIIYLVFRNLNINASDENIIRYINRKNFIISKIISSIIIIIAFILLNIFISIIGSIGLSFSPILSKSSEYIFSTGVINLFNSPFVVILISIVLLILSFTLIANIIILSSLFLKSNFVCLPAICLWGTSLVGMRIVGCKKLYGYAFINTNMLLHQSLDISKHGVIISICIMLILNLLLITISLKRIESFDFLGKAED